MPACYPTSMPTTKKQFRIPSSQSQYINRLKLEIEEANPDLVLTRSHIVQVALLVLEEVAKHCAFDSLDSPEDFRARALEKFRESTTKQEPQEVDVLYIAPKPMTE